MQQAIHQNDIFLQLLKTNETLAMTLNVFTVIT